MSTRTGYAGVGRGTRNNSVRPVGQTAQANHGWIGRGRGRATSNVTRNAMPTQHLSEDLKPKRNVTYESSSDEEDDLDQDVILTSTMKTYTGTLDGDTNNISSTTQYLFESCQSGAIICLVCISSVKRQEAIWNCSSCFAIFHLGCIQRWVREGTVRNHILSDEHFPNKEQPWFCPKCRSEYEQRACPTRYTCYCGKTEDPPFDPWLLPHTCGTTCDRPLRPDCGHKCLLLCHPGPCPPCPKTVKIGCHCGKRPKTVRRCGAAAWSCGLKCEKLLQCGKHKCQDNCHEGGCSTCLRTSFRSCVCGRRQEERPCAEPDWACGETCGKRYSCGMHSCEKICHGGKCGDCPRSGMRTCPCGKSVFSDLSCVDDVPTCEDTCGKSLGCYGGHKCTRRCHYGPCGPCPLMVEKKCRCGKRKKEMQCHKEFLCDMKCQKLRNCGNHQCKRKCCDGQCTSCDQICGRTLQCKRHKCQSLCHQGHCYPCILTSRITCNCGSNGITVVCGKEKTTRPPRCKKPCRAPSTCHHPARQAHNCHFGKCPHCKQICNVKLKCGHSCPADCHDEVIVKNKVKAAGPWELSQQPECRIECLPCPPCRFPVPMQCLGSHETANLPCHEAKRYPCGRKCGRSLRCGNHTCSLMCHTVKGAVDDVSAGSNCAECEEPCCKPRPSGCTHSCSQPCHSGPCPSCKKRLRMRCHCAAVILHHVCSDWTAADEAAKVKVASCGNNCPKLLTCGHLCSLPCHPGPCPGAELCTKKMTVRCSCKRRKKELICRDVQQGSGVLCNDACSEAKAKAASETEARLREKKAEEERLQQIELEKFERKMHKTSKSRRKRKSSSQDENDGRARIFSRTNIQRVGILIAILVLAVYGYHLVSPNI